MKEFSVEAVYINVYIGIWGYLYDCVKTHRIGTSNEYSRSSISDGTLVIISYVTLRF